MKILTILGSPRKKGNTNAVLTLFEEQVKGEHEVERVNITDHNVKGCIGCDRCQRHPDGLNCGRRDDGVRILESILEADLVVYASPVYVWGFTSQMKALLDRHYCAVKWEGGKSRSLMEGKPLMVLLTCADPKEEIAELVLQPFRLEAQYLKCPVAGEFVVDRTTVPEELGERALETARAMASRVMSIGG